MVARFELGTDNLAGQFDGQRCAPAGQLFDRGGRGGIDLFDGPFYFALASSLALSINSWPSCSASRRPWSRMART